MLVPARIDEPELLDLGYGHESDVRTNLAEITTMNRYLGGIHALASHLYPRLLATRGITTLADLGTGSADIPRIITRWARKRGRKLRIIGLDTSSRNLACARLADSPEIHLLQADANRLPLAPGSVDYVISSLFLHHLPPDSVVALLRSASACARRGLVISDIVRGWLPLAAFTLIQPVYARNFLTKHDGKTSIRRAYTPSELRDFADAAGLPHAQVHAHFPWRMTLVADK